MKKEYFNISINSISLFLIVTTSWIVGSMALMDTLTHFASQWYWFVLATIYTLTLNEIFCHRICAHQLFQIDPNRIAYKILIFLLTVDHAWSPITSIAPAHLNHHMYSDQNGIDNLNWRRYWYNICLLSPISYVYQTVTIYPNEKQFFDRQYKRFSDILDDVWTFFVEEYRIILTIIYWVFLYIVAPIVLFKIVLMGRLLMSIFMAMSAIFGHMTIPFSYRNYDTNDTTHNNLILHYFSLGIFSSMLHNNHHSRPKALNHAYKWFEFDTGYYIIILLRPFLEKKNNNSLPINSKKM